MLLQWWTNAVDYPLVISGKPLFSLPANIPITFELIVLFSALAAFGGTLVLNRLPQFWHPAFGGPRFGRGDQRRLLHFHRGGRPKFDEAAAAAPGRVAGGQRRRAVLRAGGRAGIPQGDGLDRAALVVLAALPPLWIARTRLVKSATPRIEIFADMDFQPKYKTQAASPLFADGRAMRPPVPGTMSAGRPGSRRRTFTAASRRQVGCTTFPMQPSRRDDGARPGAIQHLLRAPATAGRARATA